MPPSTPETAPVERFHATSGRFLGVASLAVVAAVIVLAAVTEPNLTGVRICLLVALAGLVIWVVLLRPRATAYDDRLVLHNQLSDWQLPLAEVEDVAVRHTLNVWVGERRYTCAGIGRSSRQMIRGPGGAPSSLFARSDSRTGAGNAAEIDRVDYATFVENRIDELARVARREGLVGSPARLQWSVPELAGMAFLTLATLVAFVV